MADYSRISTSHLLNQVGTRLKRPGANARDVATYVEYDNLWAAPGPLSKEAEEKEVAIRQFCIGILNG